MVKEKMRVNSTWAIRTATETTRIPSGHSTRGAFGLGTAHALRSPPSSPGVHGRLAGRVTLADTARARNP